MNKFSVATLAVAALLGSTAAKATDLEVIHWWTSPGESRAVAEFAKALDGDGQDHWVDGAIADGCHRPRRHHAARPRWQSAGRRPVQSRAANMKS